MTAVRTSDIIAVKGTLSTHLRDIRLKQQLPPAQLSYLNQRSREVSLRVGAGLRSGLLTVD